MQHCFSKFSLASTTLFRKSRHYKCLLNTCLIPCLFKNDDFCSKIKYQFSNKKEEISKANLKLFQHFVTDETVLSKLKISGLHHVFPIQEQSFNYILDGRDVVASDKVGTGKTLAYALPVFQKFKKAQYTPKDLKVPKLLILCPTRELALQITAQINKFNPGYKVVTVYGGESLQSQISNIEKGAAILVATPERLVHLIDRKSIQLNELEIVCLDEADTMVERSFKQDIDRIYKQIANSAGKTQNIMFSASFPSWVIKIANEYFTNFKRINLIKDNQEKTLQKVNHFALLVKQGEKQYTVTQLIQKYSPENRTIIFARTKAEVNDFLKFFDNKELVILHGDSPQATKQTNLDQFKSGNKKILITDMAVQALDMPEVELVIQLSPPENSAIYVHRAQKARKQGITITFFDQTNITNLLQIEQQDHLKIQLINKSFNNTLWKNQVTKLVDRVIATKSSSEHTVYERFAEQILQSTNPQAAITSLLKQRLGKTPKTTSALTDEKGYISYKYNIGVNQSPDLKEQFPTIQLFNITQEANCIKFDIKDQDCFKCEQIIRELGLDIELFDDKNTVSLAQYYQHLMKNAVSHENERHFSEHAHHYKRQWRKQNYLTNDKYNKNIKRQTQKHREIVNKGAQPYKYFLYGFSDITEEEMENQIRLQTNIEELKVKIFIRNSDMGDKKVFGFLTLTNHEDSDKFMNCHVNINGFILKKKVSTDA